MSNEPSTAGTGAAGASPSKAARVWKRTWVGALLTAALAALIALSFRSEEGGIVLAASGAITLLAVRELSRMGRFAEHELGAPLFVATVGVLTAIWNAAPAAPIDVHTVLIGCARAAVLALATRGAAEIARSLGAGRPGSRAAACGALSALVFATRAGEGAGSAAPLFWGISLAFALALLARRSERSDLALLAALAPWIAFPLPASTDVWRAFGPLGLSALIALSKIGDVAGYYVGNAIGRHHPFPRISPGKTTAGCVASLLAGAAAGGCAVAFGLLPDRPLGIAGGVLAGALVNIAAQAGDLLESKAKRWAGVKDAGSWFGPSGGMLDLVDSLLLSVPVALATWPWLFATS